jgi:hypothetical protein
VIIYRGPLYLQIQSVGLTLITTLLAIIDMNTG